MAGATHAETSFWHKPAGAVRSCCKVGDLVPFSPPPPPLAWGQLFTMHCSTVTCGLAHLVANMYAPQNIPPTTPLTSPIDVQRHSCLLHTLQTSTSNLDHIASPVIDNIKAGPPLEAILVIFGRRPLIFFVWKLLEKNEKWRHFCAHAQWWSPWRRKNVEKGHLTPSNLTFLLFAIDTNGFRRMKEEGLIYKTLPQIF